MQTTTFPGHHSHSQAIKSTALLFISALLILMANFTGKAMQPSAQKNIALDKNKIMRFLNYKNKNASQTNPPSYAYVESCTPELCSVRFRDDYAFQVKANDNLKYILGHVLKIRANTSNDKIRAWLDGNNNDKTIGDQLIFQGSNSYQSWLASVQEAQAMETHAHDAVQHNMSSKPPMQKAHADPINTQRQHNMDEARIKAQRQHNMDRANHSQAPHKLIIAKNIEYMDEVELTKILQQLDNVKGRAVLISGCGTNTCAISFHNDKTDTLVHGSIARTPFFYGNRNSVLDIERITKIGDDSYQLHF